MPINAAIAESLGHGVLPFTGRASEVQRIVRFWRGTFHAVRLRALLVTGEAGIGKTSLIEEAIRKVEEEGGTTIQLRLYPETTVSIAQLLARALWLAPASRSLLKIEPEATIQSTVTALRRIIRLRPTVLAIDNLHLLDRSVLADLAALIDALSDEPLALLVTARPAVAHARPILERVLVDQIELRGLSSEEIERLCGTILGSPASDEIVRGVMDASLGNPLAIRTAMRGALVAQTITCDESGGRWSLRVSRPLFRQRLAGDVETLSTGMIVHLSDEERLAARMLASLGEVFSREAGEALLGDRRNLLAVLQAKGILIDGALNAYPLSGGSGRSTPLAFSHSLLHRGFLNTIERDRKDLVAIINAGFAIYSIVPIQLIAEASDLAVSADAIEQMLDRAVKVAGELDETTDWRLGMEIGRFATMIFERHAHMLAPATRRTLELRLLLRRVYQLRRERRGQQFAEAANALLRATDGFQDEESARYRIRALVPFIDGFDKRAVVDAVETEIVDEIDAIVERFPALRDSHEYLVFLENLGTVATTAGDFPMLHRLVRLLDETLARAADEKFRKLALGMVGPRILLCFETREQLDARLALLRQLEQTDTVSRSQFPRIRATFLKTTFRYEETLTEMEKFMPELVNMGLRRIRHQWLIARQEMLAAFGADLDSVEREVRALVQSAPGDGSAQVRRYAGGALASICSMRGEYERSIRLLDEFIPVEDQTFMQQYCAALTTGEVSRLRFDEEALGWEFYNVGLLLAGREDADVPHALKYVEEVLTQEVLREQELDLLHIGLHTIQMLAPRYPEVAELHKRLFPKIQERIGRTLELLASERAFAFMTALLDRWSDYFPAREMKRWRARAAAVRASWEADHPRSADKRSIRVSMFGRIEIAHGDEEPKATRGSRLRTLLGLMVANQVLDHPLTLEEFCAIAESELDFERSKNNLHVGIHRLREAVGHDAVLTDQRTPRLNPEIVRVDLIEAHSLLGEANTALRTGHLIRAWSALRNALEITGGEVPYPTLYDGFFEAARQDFELLLRETTIAVARAFLLEEDAASAAKVLRLAIASAPGDDELSELLADALIRSGKRAEARRVKIGADT